MLQAEIKKIEQMLSKETDTKMIKLYKDILKKEKASVIDVNKAFPNKSKTKIVIKKALKKKSAKKKSKPSEKDINALKKQIKQKTGKTEAECIAIVEQYKALRDKAQKRKKSAEKSSKKVAKETKQGKRIDGKKTASTIIRETTIKTAPIINKEIDKVGIKEETDRLFKETKILVDSIKVELSKYDKMAGKDYLLRLRKEIDKLLKQKFGGGGFTSASNIQAGMISVGNNAQFEEGGITDSNLVTEQSFYNSINTIFNYQINVMDMNSETNYAFDSPQDMKRKYNKLADKIGLDDEYFSQDVNLALPYFWMELSDPNKRKLANFIYNNSFGLNGETKYSGGGFTSPSNIQAGMISVGNNSQFETGGEIFDGSGDSVNFAKGGLTKDGKYFKDKDITEFTTIEEIKEYKGLDTERKTKTIKNGIILIDNDEQIEYYFKKVSPNEYEFDYEEEIEEFDFAKGGKLKNLSDKELVDRVNSLYARGKNDDDEVAELFKRSKEKGFKVNPKYDTYEIEYAKGGMMQGYNDRADEGLGNRNGRGSNHKQNYKDRRDEMKGENRAFGNKTYGMFAKGGMTISKIKELSSETSPYFFDRKSMKMFGQTMRDFKVRKMNDGRYKISAPSYMTSYRTGERKKMGDTIRYFNTDNNKLELR